MKLNRQISHLMKADLTLNIDVLNNAKIFIQSSIFIYEFI